MVDALGEGQATGLAPFGDDLLQCLDDPLLGSLVTDDGADCRQLAIEALMSLGYPWALGLRPEELALYRARAAARRWSKWVVGPARSAARLLCWTVALAALLVTGLDAVLFHWSLQVGSGGSALGWCLCSAAFALPAAVAALGQLAKPRGAPGLLVLGAAAAALGLALLLSFVLLSAPWPGCRC
jgi:hypothetical protein